MSSEVSGVSSEVAASELADSVPGEETPRPPPPPMLGKYPPYPPYVAPAPPSVADTIIAGREIRVQHKNVPKPSVRPLPRPAKPKGPKATDVKMSRRAMRQHARCLRRHGAVLTDRLERLSKPPRRSIIYLWREHAHTLPAETIARLRAMLDADEPFKPDQAYEYFINMRKTKKYSKKLRNSQIKKDVQTICVDRRFVWARNATVAFARGIQQRLTRPGRYQLADGMLRLSNIILEEICGYLRMRTPSRRCTHPKGKFMMEMSDKIAVWIDEILSESDDRMLMMDFDEDDDILYKRADGFVDDFLNMMGGGGLLIGPTPAYLKFSGEMLEAFMILTNSMYEKGSQQLLSLGKFQQTYAQGANELKETPDFEATEFNTTLAKQLKKDLGETAAPKTPPNIQPYMKDMVEICSNYLAQNAEFNKDKGPAFKALVKKMKTKPKDLLYQKEKAKRTYGNGATELEKARGLDSDHDDPNLSQEIHSKLSNLMANATPPELKEEMPGTLDLCSKYLSQCAIDEIERGPAFDILVKKLENDGSEPFTPQYKVLGNKYTTAYTLKSAPGFGSVTPDPATAPLFERELHSVVDQVTPPDLKEDMNDVIRRSGKYLSAFVRDREKALQVVLSAMKKEGTKELVKRENYSMNYLTGATETETTKMLVPFLPVKDIADENKEKLSKDVEKTTPPNLNVAVKCAVNDVSKYLSQPVALKSGAAGTRYGLDLVGKMIHSLGNKLLFKYKSYGQTFSDGAETLKYAGPLQNDPKAENLRVEIASKLHKDIPGRAAPTVGENISGTVDEAAKHLAKVGREKGEAVEHLVKIMKEEGATPLGILQGYEQTHAEGGRRIEQADSFANDKVDKGTYEGVRNKLTVLNEKKPNAEVAKVMPEVIEDASKFLSSPFPETDEEKRRVLAALMARKGDETLTSDSPYSISYTEGGKEIINAPIGVTTSHDQGKKKKIEGAISSVIPDNKRLQESLRTPASEGAAYITDISHGRGEAMAVIQNALKKEGSREFLSVGNFNKSYDGAGEMLKNAPGFGGEHPNEILLDKVTERVENLDLKPASSLATQHMPQAIEISSRYIADKATKESGLDASAISAWAAAGGGAFSSRAASGGALSQTTTGGGASSPTATGGGASSPTTTGGGALSQTATGGGALSPTASGAGALSQTAVGGGASSHSPIGGGALSQSAIAGGATPQSPVGAGASSQSAIGGSALPRSAIGGDALSQSAIGGGDLSARSATAVPLAPRFSRDIIQERLEADHRDALAILTRQLAAKGGEVFYKQPRTELSHKQAADWLMLKPPMKVDKTVKESGDTARLQTKFERKLNTLVEKHTPEQLQETMQDVVIESSQILSEYFVSKNYKALVKEALIAEMQKRGTEILVEQYDVAETAFFAAQRLKRAQSLEVQDPTSLAPFLRHRIESVIRCRSIPRRLEGTMKEHVTEAAGYLSTVVCKPDEYISAYVALLDEMGKRGDALLVEGNIPKSFKNSVLYLRSLISFEDHIHRPNSGYQSAIESKLYEVMKVVPPQGYKADTLKTVITETTRHLVSYIMLQEEKTAALELVVVQLDQEAEGLLLRHGDIRKCNADGAALLRGKNTDQLPVSHVDPVVARKIQVKMNNLMEDANVPQKYAAVIEEVISDVTMYLAVHLLLPRTVQVCKCMKSVFVQCELWCDEILRRVARPCCSCVHNVSAQALSDLVPSERITAPPGSSTAFAPGVQISLKPCPVQSRTCNRPDLKTVCPSPNPTGGCSDPTTSYMLYATQYERQRQYVVGPTKLPRPNPISGSSRSGSSLPETVSRSPMSRLESLQSKSSYTVDDSQAGPSHSEESQQASSESTPWSFRTPLSSSNSENCQGDGSSNLLYGSPLKTRFACLRNERTRSQLQGLLSSSTRQKKEYSCCPPTVSTDQMTDWHAMMVSLTWNVRAWRNWIQDTIDFALTYRYRINNPSDLSEEHWQAFRKRIATEALQWRQYNLFSRQLTLRLALRYRDKQIVSPTRATVKTHVYLECQKEMLEILNMFNRWTHWLTVVVKETDELHDSSNTDVQNQRWNYFKAKVENHAEDWLIYNTHLEVCWENQYMMLIKDQVPSWSKPGLVWVVSAYGAVPCGAVAAGVVDGEPTWVARTTHRCRVLPAALRPSKHCCVLYADGAVHHYTKYQVMCNAEVVWVAWRAGGVCARAVRVAPGVLVGRVLYRGSHLLGAVHAPSHRCHVVIFGRPFAFKCYELLVMDHHL